MGMPSGQQEQQQPAEATATAATTSTLSFYWDLASIDTETRLKAAISLTQALATLQADHDSTLLGDKTTSKDLPDTDIDARCPQDVAYGLRRLLRGLPSSRDGARQGFALALTELLATLQFLRVDTILNMLKSFTEITKGMKGQVGSLQKDHDHFS
jgi:DNA polymerase phi